LWGNERVVGFITSPILSNIYMKEFDNIFYGRLKELGQSNIIYTRYADDMIISFNTRKTLSNIYDVCKKLVRGELFSINDRDYFVIFNKFIINNYPRINDIIEKIIHVKSPEKLIELSKEFYSSEEFYLDILNLNRKDEDINYDYFKENKNDFMQHKSICFSIKDLFLLYHIVESNKERFEDIKKNYEEISNIKDMENDSSLENNYFSLDYVFLSAQPIASIALYSNNTYNFKCFSINGNELKKYHKHYDDSKLIKNKEKNKNENTEGMSFPLIITDSQFNDYLLYIYIF